MKRAFFASILLGSILSASGPLSAQTDTRPVMEAPAPPPPVEPARDSPAPEPIPESATTTSDLPALRKDVIAAFETMPIFEERVKPFETYARLKLLRYSGYTSALLSASDGNRRLTPTEWLVASIFHPEAVQRIPIFLVDDTRLVTRLGIEADKARDRFSFAELRPVSSRILKFLVDNRQSVQNETITPEDKRLYDLCMNFRDYELLLAHFDFMRQPLNFEGAQLPESIVKPGEKTIAGPELISRLLAMRRAGGLNQELTPETQTIFASALEELNQNGLAATTLAVLPGKPEAVEGKEYFTHWTHPGAVILRTFEADNLPTDGEVAQLKEWGALYSASLQGADQLAAAASALNAKRGAEAATSGGTELPGPKLGMEVSYHKMDYFFRSGMLFSVLFLFIALSWLSPNSTFGLWMRRIGSWGLLIPLILVSTGIAIRMMLLNNNPVTSLYETIPFITSIGVAVCLIMESKLRNGLASGVAAFAGFAGMWLTYLFETRLDAGVDTIQNLQAVLRSNFWLRTHVTTIAIGYSGGAIAALFSMTYLLGRLTRIAPGGSKLARTMTRMAYGALAFCLLFSIIGTILGGIWANYSWGRFWGWDPKENGALMICLWAVLILHARLGGYLKEAGLHCLTLILGAIISFSWFGVNQLSIGLHAYGFNEKLQTLLNILYATTLGGALLCGVFWIADRGKKTAQRISGEPATAR